MARLQDKVAIVMGAASGIGRATALRFAGEGARVVCADVNEAGALETIGLMEAAGGKGLACSADVRDEVQVKGVIEATLETFGAIDVLHNNVGSVSAYYMERDLEILAMEADFWRDVFAVNLDGTFFACKHALPHMIAGGGGSIINTASVSALSGETIRPAYGAAKAAVVQLTRTLATTYGKAGVRVNAIAPGAILGTGGERQAPPWMVEMYEDSHVTPRLGRPEDIAAMALFLASDEAEFVTGQVIPVDGGFLSHWPTYAAMNARAAKRGL